MYSEAKKLHLIEDLIKIKSEVLLLEIEVIVNKATKIERSKITSAHDFLGLFSNTDVLLIDAAINEGCEQVNPDDWK